MVGLSRYLTGNMQSNDLLFQENEQIQPEDMIQRVRKTDSQVN